MSVTVYEIIYLFLVLQKNVVNMKNIMGCVQKLTANNNESSKNSCNSFKSETMYGGDIIHILNSHQ